jgi:ketosteroid isomerase-like protein
MSQENVEAAKRANTALNRGDFEGVGEAFAPDAVLEDLQNAPDQLEGYHVFELVSSGVGRD